MTEEPIEGVWCGDCESFTHQDDIEFALSDVTSCPNCGSGHDVTPVKLIKIDG